MENSIIVNNKDNENVHFGFWVVKRDRIPNLKYVITHNNKQFTQVHKIDSAFEVECKSEFRNASNRQMKGKTKWVFKTRPVDSDVQDIILHEVTQDLGIPKGYQGPRFTNVEL